MKKTTLRPIIRKSHRLLGLFIGIQFLGWTVSGLYFSWTDIDQIHGDYFLEEPTLEISQLTQQEFTLIDSLFVDPILSIERLTDIPSKRLVLINNQYLIDVTAKEQTQEIDAEIAELIARNYLKEKDLKIKEINYIENVDAHHEYRGRPLPAWAIHFDHSDQITAYISASNAQFQRVRHTNWRIFDFLWMFHTMDYQGRDNFNNWLLRIFSVFGLFTVFSGFTLYALTYVKPKSRIKKT
jgi:hypothetical protein